MTLYRCDSCYPPKGYHIAPGQTIKCPVCGSKKSTEMQKDGHQMSKPYFRVWHHKLGVMDVDHIMKELWTEIQEDANLRSVSGKRAMEILCDPQGNLFILDTCNEAHCVNQSKWVGVALDDWASK